MMLLIFGLLGGIAGLWTRHYLSHFSLSIQRQVYVNFAQIFPTLAPVQMPKYSSLMPLKCDHWGLYFINGAILFLICYLSFPFYLQALFVAISMALLFLLAKLDWHYQLIPIELCHLLTALSIGATYFDWHFVSLSQAVQSYAYSFVFFWILFHLAAYCYKREALGRGDYWLIASLATVHPWQNLPLMIFIASLSALLFILIRRTKSKLIAFAPFLIFGHIFSLLLNVLA